MRSASCVDDAVECCCRRICSKLCKKTLADSSTEINTLEASLGRTQDSLAIDMNEWKEDGDGRLENENRHLFL